MTYKKHIVSLRRKHRKYLREFVSTGKRNAREFQRAWILLMADKGKTDEEIGDLLNLSTRTIERTRETYVKEGLETALLDLPRSGQPRKLSESQEAEIIAVACSNPPEGREHWTIEMLKEEAIRRKIVDNISTEPIRILLRERDLKPWLKKPGASRKLPKNSSIK